MVRMGQRVTGQFRKGLAFCLFRGQFILHFGLILVLVRTLLAFPCDDAAHILLVAPQPVAFQVAFDFTAVLKSTDTIASATWTSADPLLAPSVQAPSGAVTSANFTNSLPQGHSARVDVVVTSAAGQIEARSFRVVAVYR